MMKRSLTFDILWGCLSISLVSCHSLHSDKPRSKVEKPDQPLKAELCASSIGFDFKEGEAAYKQFYEHYIKETALEPLKHQKYSLPLMVIQSIPRAEFKEFKEKAEALLKKAIGEKPLILQGETAIQKSQPGFKLQLAIEPKEPEVFAELNEDLAGFIEDYRVDFSDTHFIIPSRFQVSHFIPMLPIASASQLKTLGLLGKEASEARKKALKDISEKLKSHPTKFELQLKISPCL